jgi:predicted class III extradiol MEMO1 family dioxygenase
LKIQQEKKIFNLKKTQKNFHFFQQQHKLRTVHDWILAFLSAGDKPLLSFKCSPHSISVCGYGIIKFIGNFSLKKKEKKCTLRLKDSAQFYLLSLMRNERVGN